MSTVTDPQESHLRKSLQPKKLVYILDFLMIQCGRSLPQIFDSARRNILFQQLEYINNHEDNDGHIDFEPFDMQDFICIVNEVDQKFNSDNDDDNNNNKSGIKTDAHSIKFQEYKYKMSLKKTEIRDMIELRTKWMKLLIDEKKNELFIEIDNKYNNKLIKLNEYEKEMSKIQKQVRKQCDSFNKLQNNNNNNNNINFKERNEILKNIQKNLIFNKNKTQKIEKIIQNDLINNKNIISNVLWNKNEFKEILNKYMLVNINQNQNQNSINKPKNNRSQSMSALLNVDQDVDVDEKKDVFVYKSSNNNNNNQSIRNVNVNINSLPNAITHSLNDIGWDSKYCGNDIIINNNKCILSNNGINQSIILNESIKKGKTMKFELELNKNLGSGCYFIGVISDRDKCDFNGIAMYGKSLHNNYGIDDTKNWIYRGPKGIDVVNWKPEIKTNDIITIITDYKVTNQLNLWFIQNNKILLKPDNLTYSMTIPPPKLSSDYKWYIAVSLIETGSYCILKSCSILK